LLKRSRQTLSIRTTLLLRLLIPLVALVSLSTAVANRVAEQFANKSFDSFLLNSADSIAARIRISKAGVVLADMRPSPEDLFRHNGKDKFFYQIVGVKGNILVGNARLPLREATKGGLPQFDQAAVGDQIIRLCSVPVKIEGRSFCVQVAETLNSRSSLLHELFLSILIPQIALVTCAGLVVWLGVGYGLRPLNRLGSVLRSRTNPDLSPVDIGDTPPELVPVTDALNSLFLVVDRYCRSQREFIADAAHQLRTPVTALKTYIDLLNFSEGKSRDPSIFKKLDTASDRMVNMVNRLLVLARAESRVSSEPAICDLTAVVAEAAVSLIPEAQRRNIELHFDVPTDQVMVAANGADLTEAIVNLLDNAIKHIPERSLVWLSAQEEDGYVTLVIEDNGPGIPDAYKKSVFNRFFRLADSSSPGCGLGLSIVKEICTASGAALILSDRVGGGASFRVTLPAVTEISDQPTVRPTQDAQSKADRPVALSRR